MKIRVWAKTNKVGSTVETVIEVEDDLGEASIEELAQDAMFENLIQWSYEPIKDETQ